MAYIPHGARWYLATIIEEITVDGDSRNVVHKNHVLIRGDSPENAYDKAHELGRNSEISYENPKGRLVRIRFKGLSELHVIYDELDHGAELYYEELTNLSQAQIEALCRPKAELAVFQPISPSLGPDYRSREIVEKAEDILKSDSEMNGR